MTKAETGRRRKVATAVAEIPQVERAAVAAAAPSRGPVPTRSKGRKRAATRAAQAVPELVTPPGAKVARPPHSPPVAKTAAARVPGPTAGVRGSHPERAGPVAAQVRAVVGRPGLSLVQQAVDALRRAVLDSPGPGVFLGSEEQLIDALGVSRPTFRQAAKLLRHENLLEIKRGMGGGFFTCSPSADAVSRMAAIFLNAQGTSMRQINDVVGPLQSEVARMLARNPDRAVRARLQEFITASHQAEQAGGEPMPPVRRLLAFERLLAEIVGNPAITLMINVMLDLLRDARRANSFQTQAWIAAYEGFQTRLAQAVLDGDPEMVSLICSRQGEELRRWLPDGRLELPMHEPAPPVKKVEKS